jgi:aldose 1-epimerase
MIKSKLKEYSIQNSSGMMVKLLNYGATLTAIIIPNRRGDMENILLHYDRLDDYLNHDNPYLGSTVGRYANRIAKASFQLDGVKYRLPENNFGNTLHGGNYGFDKVFWNIEQIADDKLELNYLSKDGEEGFPGNLAIKILIAVDEEHKLHFNYSATTDKATPVNLTNHAYFNLSGGKNDSVLDHILYINSNQILELDELKIPTGEFIDVNNTVYDFNNPKSIGRDIDETIGGYDQNYIINANKTEMAAELYDPVSGRKLNLFTTTPGLQFYTGNFLDERYKNKAGIKFKKHQGLCLEPQYFPDSPNHARFPNTILRPGEVYHQHTIIQFSVSP